MENKLEAKFICLEEPAFFALIDQLYAKLKGGDNTPDRWVNGETVMRMLNVTSPTTLQKLRDSGAIRISQISRKLIMYDRESVEEYLEKHSTKKSWR